MTTTPAPLDLDSIRAEYDQLRPESGELADNIPKLLDELAKTRRELEQTKAQRNLAADWLEDSAEVERERDAAREELAKTERKVTTWKTRLVEETATLRGELAKTRAELDEQRATLDRVAKFADDMTTWCSPRGVSAHYAERLREVLANPATTAEPAAVHTVWDHYGPCGYCGVTTGPCLNPDDTAPWPVERKVPAPKPHPSRQLAPEAEPADEPKATATDGWPKSQECSIGAHRPCDRDYCRCECHAEAAPEPAAS